MATSTRMPRRPAAALAAILLTTLAVRAPAQADADRLLPAGRDSQYDYTVDPDSIQRDGSTVRFRLGGNSIYRGPDDNYAAQVLVDCASRQRREMGSVIHNQWVHEKRNGADSQMRDIFPGTRQESELRLVCRLAGVPVGAATTAAAPTPSPPPAPAPAAAPAQGASTDFAPLPPLQTYATSRAAAPQAVARTAEPPRPQGKPFAVAPSADLVAAGGDAQADYAIFVDSVRRRAAIASYVVQARPKGSPWATHEQYVVDCSRRLRAFRPEDSPPGVRLTATPVRADSREGRELATACALPEGPRRRWFAGVVVTSDGVVVAPHDRTFGCGTIVALLGNQRRRLELLAQEADVSVLKLSGGGPWPVMPSRGGSPQLDHLPVTMLGVSGTTPRVSAAFAEDAGSNEDDPGWPQVATLPDAALTEGIVWDGSGSAIGLALAMHSPARRGTRAYVRMLPAAMIRQRLKEHGINWNAISGRALDAEAAMRLAVSATVALACEAGT